MPAPSNPHRDLRPFQLLRLGGRLFRCVLHAVNGLVIEDEYNVQKPTGSSGAVAVFKGTKIAEEITMELRAYAGPLGELQFDDMYDLCEMLKPAPGLAGGTGSAAPSTVTPQSFSAAAQKRADAAATPAAAGGTSTVDTAAATTKADKSSTPNPGPRPPTLLIENAFFNDNGVFAVSRKKVEAVAWDREHNFWSRKVTVIQAKPPTPANVGAQSTAKPGAPGGEFSGAAQSKEGAANTPAQAKFDATRSPV